MPTFRSCERCEQVKLNAVFIGRHEKAGNTAASTSLGGLVWRMATHFDDASAINCLRWRPVSGTAGKKRGSTPTWRRPFSCSSWSLGTAQHRRHSRQLIRAAEPQARRHGWPETIDGWKSTWTILLLKAYGNSRSSMKSRRNTRVVLSDTHSETIIMIRDVELKRVHVINEVWNQCRQCWKCNRMCNVPPPPIYGPKRSPTSNCYNARDSTTDRSPKSKCTLLHL